MPGFFTHYLCGHKILERINNSTLKKIITKHMELFNLGTQGPDIFFYYGFWPWVKSKEFHEIGEKIHSHNVNLFFSNALEYIMEREPSERDPLLAYLCGYACHYSLDFNTHPYVFYKTGFVRKDEIYTPKYTYYHRLFETTIDFLLVSETLDCKPSEIKARSLIKLDSTESSAVGSMLCRLLQNIFGIKMKIEQVQNAIKDMGNALSVLRDRTGLKRRLLNSIELHLGPYPLMSSMIHPLELNDSLDYLNRHKSSWSMPWDNEISSSSSFDEMFEYAVSVGTCMCEAIYNFVQGVIPKEKALELIGNRSFSTGVNCDMDLEFKFFDCIYEQENA